MFRLLFRITALDANASPTDALEQEAWAAYSWQSICGGGGGSGVFRRCVSLGVFGLSLVLISRFAPQQVPDQVPAEALSSNLSSWVMGIVSVAAIVIGAKRLIFRVMHLNASDEMRSVIATKAAALERLAPGQGGETGLPNVPRGKSITDSPGEYLSYRLPILAGQDGILGPALLALFWNTAWIILLAVVVSGFLIDRPRWIIAGLLIPFALIGRWSFQYFVSQMRQRLGVGPTVLAN